MSVSGVNPGKGHGDHARCTEASEALGGLRHAGCPALPGTGAHSSSPSTGQAGALGGSSWPSIQPWALALKPGYGAYPEVRSQPGNGSCGRALWGCPRGCRELRPGPGPTHSSGETEQDRPRGIRQERMGLEERQVE